MGAVRLRHVLRDGRMTPGHIAAHVQPDAHTAQQHVDGRRRQAHVDGGVNQRMRDGVIVPVDLDVIIDIDAGVGPIGVDVAIPRQRLQRRPIEALEERAPRAAAVRFHRPVIEIDEQLGDPRVQRGQGEEGLVPQPRENPAFGDLHGDFDLRLVAGLRRSRGDDRRPVVPRPLRIRPLDPRLIPTRIDHAGPQLIRDDH